jgi:N-acetylglucosaminyldiphosphoundecaprenol N-acetyl-beta-D-mannosaminyltransferase
MSMPTVDGNSSPANDVKTERVLGVNFFVGDVASAVDHFQKVGGYMVVPAAPALVNLNYDEEYRRALQHADLALPDSNLIATIWRFVAGGKLRKISGIAYLKCLLGRGEIREAGDTLWVLPSDDAREKTNTWLRAAGFPVDPVNFCVAQRQSVSAENYDLLVTIEKQRPRNVVIAVTGGTQEKLGLYLREYLLYRPRIHCIGAALGFLTGSEAAIPEWAERHNLGWLCRIASQPRMFFPRLGIAYVLAKMVLKYRSELPPLRTRWVDV